MVGDRGFVRSDVPVGIQRSADQMREVRVEPERPCRLLARGEPMHEHGALERSRQMEPAPVGEPHERQLTPQRIDAFTTCLLM